MQLSELLNPDFITVRVSASSKNEVIGILLDQMFSHYRFEHSREQVQEAIEAREALKGTVFSSGLAVPHARIELFNDLLIGIASMETPLREEDVDVKLVVLILTSRTTSNLYLNCLAAFGRLSKNSDFMEKLGLVDNPLDLIELVRTMDIEVKPELTVESIMSRELLTVRASTPLRTVIDLMCENDVSFAPVTDDDGNLLGELSALEIMKLGIPNYSQMIGNTNVLKAFEPMEKLLEKEDSLCAQDLMEPPTNTFSRHTSIVEAVFTFIKTRKRHIPVLERQQIIGLVTYMDVLRKVLRA